MAAVTLTTLALPPEKNKALALLAVGALPEENRALGTVSKPRRKLAGVSGWAVTSTLVVATRANGLLEVIALGVGVFFSPEVGMYFLVPMPAPSSTASTRAQPAKPAMRNSRAICSSA